VDNRCATQIIGHQKTRISAGGMVVKKGKLGCRSIFGVVARDETIHRTWQRLLPMMLNLLQRKQESQETIPA
jgi:hypothetical protein